VQSQIHAWMLGALRAGSVPLRRGRARGVRMDMAVAVGGA
jgi:hypothetical protein